MLLISQSRLYNEDCMRGINNLSESYGKFVDCAITSPPYAQQRKNQYGGVKEEDYPQWTLEWMSAVEKVLKEDGSVFINIRPHIKNGQISDYVLKTRLLLRENGWIENEELIWIKPDSPPLGSIHRPRRAWEHILWFSKTSKPFCRPKNNGNVSSRVGFEGDKFEHGGDSHIHAGQKPAKVGISRHRDYIECGTGMVEKGYSNSAMFPPQVPEYLINLSCSEDGIVLDPFMGSGTTMRQAVRMNRGFVGFDTSDKDYDEAHNSLMEIINKQGLQDIYKDMSFI